MSTIDVMKIGEWLEEFTDLTLVTGVAANKGYLMEEIKALNPTEEELIAHIGYLYETLHKIMNGDFNERN